MSSCCEDDLESLESRGSGSCATAEPGDVEGCIEKLKKFGTVRVSIFEKEEAQEWLKKIQAHSKVTWRVLRTYPGGLKNLFKTKYRCHHNARYKKELTGRNTGCPARLVLLLKRTELVNARRSKSNDPLITSHPLIVTLQGEHNHPIDAAAALKYRDVSEEVQKHLKDLFADGLSPSAAYDLLRSHLMASDPDNYIFNAADRHILPDLQYCYNLYYSVCRKEYSGPDGDALVTAAKAKAAANSDTMACRTIGDKAFMFAIVTPVMKRAHELKKASQIVFVDSTGNLDRHDLRVFLFMTHTAYGGVPLGVVITNNEQAATLDEAFHLLASLLPVHCFGGRGADGPAVFMTDNCEAERTALRNVWPKSSLVLCIFHVMQATWRWLMTSKHNIAAEDRPRLMRLVQKAAYANSVTSALEVQASVAEDPLMKTYGKFWEYFHGMLKDQEKWVLAYRSCLPTRGHNTNNYAESAMRILKDSILKRTRAYNVLQLIDFLSTGVNEFYSMRLCDVAIERCQHLNRRFMPPKDQAILSVKQLSENTFEVVDDETTHIVDNLLDQCSCQHGINGGPCKHQFAAYEMHREASVNVVPQSSAERHRLQYLATGQYTAPPTWFTSLHDYREAAGTAAEAPSSQAQDATRQSEASHTQHSPDAELQSSQAVIPFVCSDVEQCSEDGAAQESTDEWLQILGTIRSFVDEEAAAATAQPERRKYFAAFAKTIRRLGRGRALDCAFLAFGQRAVPSLRATKSCTTIGVQPTAIARRKMPLGGRKRIHAGRRVSAEQSAKELLQVAKRRKTRATHSLSQCVDNNTCLGKSH